MSRVVLVPTPIGNLQDITLRALEALREADVVAAEDTRHSARLLAHHAVETKLVRLDAHTMAERAPRVLAEHERVAYITDAGTPGVSDPGAELVRLALELGHEVEALPGPTAFVPALVLSGLPVARFAFEGFLPRRGRERRERLERIAGSLVPVALYESPRRLAATLAELAEVCGGARRASVSRELTKRFEETVRGTLTELAGRFGAAEPRGEIVVVVAPAEPKAEAPAADLAEQARKLAGEGLAGRDLRRALTALGAPRNLAYELALAAESERAEGA